MSAASDPELVAEVVEAPMTPDAMLSSSLSIAPRDVRIAFQDDPSPSAHQLVLGRAGASVSLFGLAPESGEDDVDERVLALAEITAVRAALVRGIELLDERAALLREIEAE